MGRGVARRLELPLRIVNAMSKLPERVQSALSAGFRGGLTRADPAAGPHFRKAGNLRASPRVTPPMKMTQLPIRSSGRGAPEPAGTRARILDAADRALAGTGYRHMRIEDLARAAGIAKGTVYLSFPSKQEIALACIDRMAGRVLERMRALAAGSGPPADRLARMLVERVLVRFDYAREHSASVDEILGAIRPALLERRAAHFRSESRVLAEVLHQARGMSGPAARETAHAMVLATNALLPYSLGVREMARRAEIARRARRVADLIVRGALAQEPASARGTKGTA
ncbi:MAG: TetR/AcrR family transcriptional regulator [Candidatus Eisenbacteria bacterium]